MGRKNNRTNKKNNYNRPNLWGMLRDLGIASLNKGQFPILIVGLILIILIIKIPPNDASKLLFTLVSLFKRYYLLGWGLFCISIILWFFNTKRIRRIHTEEMKRVTDEKKELQKKLTNKDLQSSN